MINLGKIRRTLGGVGTSIIKRLLRAGIPLGPMILLTVRGRTSGQPRTTPVDLLDRDDRRWLVATHGRRREAVTAVELSPEQAGPVLKEVLGPRLASPVGGFVLRRTLDVAPDASLDAFIDEARRHPIFELRSRPEASS